MTVQDPSLSVQEEAEKSGVGLLLVQSTLPDGDSPSTVAVQVVVEPSATDVGEQETEVDEEALLTATVTALEA